MTKINMRSTVVVCILIAGVVLALFIIGTAVADLSANEMSLNFSGASFELHADESGNLWITDYSMGELWNVNSNGTSYNIYSLGYTYPSDANPDNAGNVWWLDNSVNINRLNLTTNALSTWNINTAVYLLGIGFDSTNKPWITDSADGILYSFDPSTKDACGYTVPNLGEITYPLVSGYQVWLGDTLNARLVRLDFSSSPAWTWWQLPAGSFPYFLTRDGGNIWFTDQGNDDIGQFDPSSGQLWLYDFPTSTNPWMLAVAEGNVWFTGQTSGVLGMLDPSFSSPEPQTLTPSTLSASCSNKRLQNPDTSTIVPTSGTTSWLSASYTTLFEGDGWVIYQLPDNSVPYGIALTSNGFAVDSYRQKLMRFPLIQGPTPTPTQTKTVTNTPTNTNTPTKTPTNTNTPTKTPTNTNTPTKTPTNTNTPTKTPTNTNTPTKTPTNTNTPTHTATPTSVNTHTATPTAVVANTTTPTTTAIMGSTPTSTPTITPPAAQNWAYLPLLLNGSSGTRSDPPAAASVQNLINQFLTWWDSIFPLH